MVLGDPVKAREESFWSMDQISIWTREYRFRWKKIQPVKENVIKSVERKVEVDFNIKLFFPWHFNSILFLFNSILCF